MSEVRMEEHGHEEPVDFEVIPHPERLLYLLLIIAKSYLFTEIQEGPLSGR